MKYYGAKRIYALMFSVMLVIMVGVPAFAIKPAKKQITPPVSDGNFPKGEQFSIYITEADKVEKVSAFDYIVGVVAAEMGADKPIEALKAQTVASYTYAHFRKNENGDQKYDITDSPQTDQKYLSRAQLQEKWKEGYDENIKKIESAVKEAAGYILTDKEGQPILAAYHALSGGRTESAQVVWGKDYGYLQPVESIGDLLSPDYLSVRKFTVAELQEKLQSAVTLSGEPQNWIADVGFTESGTVTAINMCGVSVSGEQIRTLLGLRSACFEASFSEEVFTFNVKGWGHGVGMSQYGACYLAQTGSTFIEILSHYYTDCNMEKV